MKFYHLSITVKNQPRGNHSGYTDQDYAIDAASQIEREASDKFTWLDDDYEKLARSSAISFAESQIAQVREKGVGGDLLGYHINSEFEDEE